MPPNPFKIFIDSPVQINIFVDSPKKQCVKTEKYFKGKYTQLGHDFYTSVMLLGPLLKDI